MNYDYLINYIDYATVNFPESLYSVDAMYNDGSAQAELVLSNPLSFVIIVQVNYSANGEL